jgi:amino acid transporter
MVGGGIFAVLGTAATQAGNAAFLAFGLAGLLALVTGLSYARLTVDFDEPGGTFTYVEHLIGPRAAGTVSWFLLMGYLFTVSLYAFTFGAYLARLFGAGEAAGPLLGAGIILTLSSLNLAGVRESGIAEDVMVVGKMVVLAVVAGVGFLAVDPAEAFPVFQAGAGRAVAAAALVFVAYEGFQLLTYDYADIEDHRRNLPRAIWISIPVVSVVYMVVAFVTTGSVADSAIARHGETVLASVAQPVLGRVGLVAVLVAAVLSTASAINATLFASARLGRHVAQKGQLPSFFTHWSRGGVPVLFVAVMAAGAIAVEMTGSLEQITTFSSLVFLVVFAVVNGAALGHGTWSGWRRIVPVFGLLGCLAAAGALVVHLWNTDRASLWIVGGISLALLAARAGHVLMRMHGSRGRD